MVQLSYQQQKKTEKVWQRYLVAKDEEDRENLIVTYLYLVKLVVARLASSLPGYVKMDDLYSSGVTGLIKAVERFDPSKNVKFETYAMVLVKGAIIDELRNLDWIPRSIHQKANKIAKEQLALAQKLGRDPTDSELSSHLGLREDEFETLLEEVKPAVLIPLNGEWSQSDEEGMSLSERIPDNKAETGLQAAHKKEFAAFLEKALADLPEQERKVLVLYYFDELMLKEIGQIIGVSESRVSQIHTKALLKLRGRLKSFAEEFVLN